MHCPFCSHSETRVVDSRNSEEGDKVRRRRECPECNTRFSTHEVPQLKLPLVVKSNGSREPFAEKKLRGSILLALQKQSVSADQIDGAVDHILREIRAAGASEVASRSIGEWVMHELKELDHVGYVRFASVYRRFEDVKEFRQEIEHLEKELQEAADNPQLPLLDCDPE